MQQNKSLVVAAAIVTIALSQVSASAAQRSTMKVTCVVLPHIALRVNGGAPVYGAQSASMQVDASDIDLTAMTNDPSAEEYVLSVSSDEPTTVNGVELLPHVTVELGRYRYSSRIQLHFSGNSPVLLTVSRVQS